MQKPAVNIFWFRRDLRLHDNHGLFHALQSGRPVVPLFIFDRAILDKLEDSNDRRVEFIHRSLEEMQQDLLAMGSTMDIRVGFPADVYRQLLTEYDIAEVFTNHDYEPYARARDAEIAAKLREQGATFKTFKDQVIFEKSEVVKDDEKPYTVFTPYSRKWKAQEPSLKFASYSTEKFFTAFHRQAVKQVPSLASIGFMPAGIAFPAKDVRADLIRNYAGHRDYPSLPGTSRLGVHLRFGTISIRELANRAATLSETFLNELIWRDFYHMILWHFPQVGEGRAFRAEYELIPWRNNEAEFLRWCEGTTGYPIVDAGMRELNETGFMHNRVRMIVASFLAKHLLIDWRWGEAYFARKLLDFDLAANNGGWQWAAGSGCDAAPYFRVFNPTLQTQKFDGKHAYIRRWVPEFEELTYPRPMVDHDFARKRCLDAYKAVLKRES
jgi:deoxyribodipyrimidine photo-lyase